METLNNLLNNNHSELFIEFIDLMPFPISIVDLNGTLLYINKTFQKTITTDISGKKCWDVYSDEKKQCEKCPLKKKISFGLVKSMEVDNILNGKYFRIYHKGIKFNGKDAVLEVFIDLTENKRAKLELEQKEKEYEDLFQNMTDCFAYHKMIYDKEGNPSDYIFLNVNKAFETFVGKTAAKLIGKRASQVLPKTNKDNVDWIKLYGEVALTMKSKNFEIHSNNWEKTVSIKAYSTKKDYFTTIFSDVSKQSDDRKVLENKIKELEVLTKIAISRELKMIELKEKIIELKGMEDD